MGKECFTGIQERQTDGTGEGNTRDHRFSNLGQDGEEGVCQTMKMDFPTKKAFKREERGPGLRGDWAVVLFQWVLG